MVRICSHILLLRILRLFTVKLAFVDRLGRLRRRRLDTDCLSACVVGFVRFFLCFRHGTRVCGRNYLVRVILIVIQITDSFLICTTGLKLEVVSLLLAFSFHTLPFVFLLSTSLLLVILRVLTPNILALFAKFGWCARFLTHYRLLLL